MCINLTKLSETDSMRLAYSLDIFYWGLCLQPPPCSSTDILHWTPELAVLPLMSHSLHRWEQVYPGLHHGKDYVACDIKNDIYNPLCLPFSPSILLSLSTCLFPSFSFNHFFFCLPSSTTSTAYETFLTSHCYCFVFFSPQATPNHKSIFIRFHTFASNHKGLYNLWILYTHTTSVQ